MQLYEIQKCLNSKRNPQKRTEATFRTGENVCDYASEQQLLFRKYKELANSTLKKLQILQ